MRPGHRELEAPARSTTPRQAASWQTAIADALATPPLPDHVGPCEFGELGRMVAVRCLHELTHILQRAGAVWEPGSRRWRVERRRIGPAIRTLDRSFCAVVTAGAFWAGACGITPGNVVNSV